MKSLLNALQEGRLVELPVTNKEKALEYLALLLEAIPDIDASQDIVKAILQRESQGSTAIGMGVACPHIRTRQEGELLCAVGWSPSGIDFNSPDGKKVHLLIMYYIPESQRNTYLKEISGLSKAIKETGELKLFSEISDLQTARNKLLDWVDIAINKMIPNAKARMIKLEEKSSKIISDLSLAQGEETKRKIELFPFSILQFSHQNFFILSKKQQIVDELDQKQEILQLMEGNTEFTFLGYHVTIVSSETYCDNRMLYHCVAIKI